MNDAGYGRATADAGLPADLECRVTVSQRRTVGLTAEPGGTLTIRVPEGLPAEHLARVLSRRLPWIIRSTARRADLSADHAVKEVIDGENFPFLGRNRRLVLDAQDDDVRLAGDRLIAPCGSPETVSDGIIRWYTRQGRDWLAERLPLWCRRAGAPPAVAEVGDLGQRWGMCTPSEEDVRVILHWASFQLPPHLIDLVIVHEAAHLVEPRHGAAFNQLMRRIIPTYSQRVAELAEVGRHVWVGSLRSAEIKRQMPGR
jgi:hypothetical protein